MLRMPEVPMPEREFERSRAHDVIVVLENEEFSHKTCVWSSKAFVSITALAMQTNNTESMADFLDDGGCEALLQIMTKYGGEDEEIAANCCLSLCILSWSLRELKEFLGELGACELLLYTISMHIGDPKVSEYGSAAIGLLAKNDISNSFKLAQDGACDIVAQVGNFGFNVRNSRCVEVATNVCFAFAQLSEAVNGNRLLACGACGLVPELCRLHLKDSNFAVAGVKAFCGLASLTAKHREELGLAGACQLIVDIVLLHSSSLELTQEAMETIMHLSLSPNNTSKLGAAGACELVIKCLSLKLMDRDFGIEVCSGAILNLITYGIACKDNRQRFIHCDAANVLRRGQFSPKSSYRARENIMALLELLDKEQLAGSAGVSLSPKPRVEDQNVTVSLIHGSEMIGDTIPLTVELREYDSFDHGRTRLPSEEDGDRMNQVESTNAVVEI